MDYDGIITLSIGTGLQDDAGTLKTKDSEIVHDNLSGFVADEHIDWTDATDDLLTTGSGRFDSGLLDSSDNLSIDLTNRLLYDANSVAFVDFTPNRYLLDEAGVVAGTFQSANRTLHDENGDDRISWVNGSGYLFDASGTFSVDWDTRILILSDGTTTVLDWENQTLSDSSSLASVDWDSRSLYDDTGNQVMLDWSTDGTADFQDNDVITTGDVQCEAISVGTGSSPLYPLDMQLAATDAIAFFVDGTTNDSTRTGTGFDFAMQFSRDHAVANGAEPINLYTMLIENLPKHVNAVIANNKFNYSGYFQYLDTSSWTTSVAGRSLSQTGVRGNLVQNGTYASTGAGALTIGAHGVHGVVDFNGAVSNAAGTNFHSFYGCHGEVDVNPSTVTGTHYFQCYGLYGKATATTEGNSWTFGTYTEALGGDVSWGLYIARSTGTTAYGIYDACGKDWVLDADDQKIILGETQDFELFFDGSYGRLDATGEPIRIGDDTTNCLEVSSTGDLTFHGTGGMAFAGIYVKDSSATISVDQDNADTIVTQWTSDSPSNNCTAASASNKITITTAGVYEVHFHASVNLDAGVTVVLRLEGYLGGVIQPMIHTHRTVSSTEVGSMGTHGFIDVTSVPVDLDIRANINHSTARALTVEDAQLTVKQVGGT
jgi:hypothetical protein